jgi:hypothetical protein
MGSPFRNVAQNLGPGNIRRIIRNNGNVCKVYRQSTGNYINIARTG